MSENPQKDWRNAVAELKELTVNRLDEVEKGSSEYQEHFERINAKLDEFEFEMKTAKPEPTPEKKEIAAKFQKYALEFAQKDSRRALQSSLDESEVKSYHPSMQKSDNLVRFDFAAAGALLLPAQVSDDIIKDVIEVTPLMGLARVTPTGRSEYKRRVRTSTPGGRWLAEEAINTKGKPTWGEISIVPHKWASMYGMTIEQSQDTGFDLVSELTTAFREDFEVDMGGAFINGDGVGKPYGLLGRVEEFETNAVTLVADDLINAQESLKDAYQERGKWLFSRKSRAAIRTLVLSSTNALQYVWEPDFTRRSPTLLLGNPVYISREGDLASPTLTSGDWTYTAAAVFAMYGDFQQGYEIVRHTDMYMIDDPYTESSAFVRNFHIMSRIGGNVIKKEAITQIKAKA